MANHHNDWRISGAALRRVTRQLNILKPVHIQWVSFRGDWLGQHGWTYNGDHQIQLVRGRPYLETAETLLHELKHASQKEANPLIAEIAYRASMMVHGYKDNRFEVEAREFAERNLSSYDDLIIP